MVESRKSLLKLSPCVVPGRDLGRTGWGIVNQTGKESFVGVGVNGYYGYQVISATSFREVSMKGFAMKASLSKMISPGEKLDRVF